MSDDLPMALSVEKVRHEMLRGILVPREIVNEALKVTAAKLHARETKFFSFKGQVREAREVEDHGTQLAAADQIFSLAGLYARERQEVASTPGVGIEVDPNTGVVRIIVGSPTQSALPAYQEAQIDIRELAPSAPSPAESLSAQPAASVADKTRRGQALEAVWKVLHDEVVDL